MEDGEKSSNYFLNLEISRQTHNTISCLKDSEGKTQHSDDDVLNVFIDIQTSKELIQMDTDKMMTYGTFTMDDEKLTQS